MPLKLALSQVQALPFDFAAQVEKFAAAKMAHRFTEGEAAPGAVHPWVEHAVRRVPGMIGSEGKPGTPDEFVADYEVVDDSAPPPTLDEQKAMLHRGVIAQANQAVDAIDPPLKRRIREIEHARIVAGLVPDTIFEKLKMIVKNPEPKTPEDAAALADHRDRKGRVEAVFKHLAQCESKIHDLTTETIDSWQPAPFPT